MGGATVGSTMSRCPATSSTVVGPPRTATPSSIRSGGPGANGVSQVDMAQILTMLAWPGPDVPSGERADHPTMPATDRGRRRDRDVEKPREPRSRPGRTVLRLANHLRLAGRGGVRGRLWRRSFLGVNIVVLTGAGISAESGLATFRDADGLWEGHRVEQVATPEGFSDDPDLVHRFYDERRARAGNAVRAECRPRGAVRAWSASGRRRSAASSCWSPRTSTTCTTGPARRTCCTCTAPCVRRGAPPAARTRRPGRRHVRCPCPECGEVALRPDVVWFGEMPRGLEQVDEALSRGRPLRLDRYVGRRLPRGRLRAAGAGASGPDAGAEHGAERGQRTCSPRAGTAPPPSWCRQWVEEQLRPS